MQTKSDSNRLVLLWGALIILLPLLLLIYPKSVYCGDNGTVIRGVVKTPWVRRFPALVYIERVKGVFPPQAGPMYISQKNMVFSPRVNPVLKGAAVDFTNDDTVVHNVFTPPGSATRFNTGNYGVGVTKSVSFESFGVSTLLCSVHPEMIAYVIALQNPYFAVTDKKGRFEIKDVPPGTYKLMAWHEKLETVARQITVEKGKALTVEFQKRAFKKR